jgi:tripeptide aminopeptidase
MTPTLPAIDEKRALKLILELLPIPGLSGKESAISSFIVKKLRAAGLPANAIKTDSAHRKSPLGGEHGNLICTLPGTISGERRLLMAHLDTVPLCAGTIAARHNGYIRSGNPQTGLGADNRSGVAATLNALLEILRRKLPHPPLTFVWPVQEEVGLYGARYLDLKPLKNPRLCFNWDGGDANQIRIGATGAYRIKIAIHGIASHAGVHPELGVSATAIAACAVADLHRRGWHGLIKKSGKLGTSNVGVISGGNATNVVTPLVNLRVEARSHDARFRKTILDEIRGAFDRAAKQVKNARGQGGKVEFEAELHYESFRLPESSPPVLTSARAIRALGMKPELNVANGGLDANWLSARGLPTVTLGAGQEHAHTVDEQLNIKAFYQGCRVALALATGA